MNEQILKPKKPSVNYNLQNGKLIGENVGHSIKYLGQLENIFADKIAYSNMDKDTVVYEVDCHSAIKEGTCGGLFYGTSYIHPGQVGNEYFMTKGHYHQRRETAEYYIGISGSGLLLLMDENNICKAEEVYRGSLHYIDGYLAHRLVNTGDETLIVGACWYSDAGHDYGSIEDSGFTARVINRDGKPLILV